MSTKLALTAAALVAILSGPAFAHGHPHAAHARDMRNVPANAFASVRGDLPVPDYYRYQNDFQLQGRF
jgi:hypothetical protein